MEHVTNSIDELIADFRATHSKDAISPDSLGYLLTQIIKHFDKNNVALLIENLKQYVGDNGKINPDLLPSYVDDVIEFDSIVDNVSGYFLGCFDQIPEQYEGLSFEPQYGNQLFFQYWDSGDSTIRYIQDHGFAAGKLIAVYQHYSAIAIFALNVDHVDLSTYGVVGDNGCATPVDGKIYVDTATDRQYRWSGSQLTMLSRPIGLGENWGEAYPGPSGAQLASQFNNFKSNTNSNINDLLIMAICQGEFNLNAIDYGPDPYSSLEEALESIKYNYLPDTLPDWPGWGSIIKFLIETDDGDMKWVRYRCIEGRTEIGDDDCLDPDNWELVEEPAGGSSDGSGSISTGQFNSLKLQVNNLKSRVTAVETSASDNSNGITALGGELADLDDVVSGQNGVLDRLTSLENTIGDKVVFVDVDESDQSACLKGAHPSGLTYNQPTTRLNLRANPSTSDILILLPADTDFIGRTIRILDPRLMNTSSVASANRVRILPYGDSRILGHTKENANYWVSLRGGYIELIGVQTTGLSYGVSWVVKSLTKFNE